MHKDIRILVVDDFSTMRRIIRNRLQELGYHDITEADDGATALPLLNAGEFDLVVTDWNMPRMDGLTLLRKVRASEKLKHIPVLMVTAEAKRDQIIVAAHAGVNDYILKPFNADELARKIERIYQRMEQ
jgi:two-component system chemotaxis response regulator CheY